MDSCGESARALRGVLFDWDGTLVDSAEVSYRAYVASFAAFGISFDRARFAETYSPDWHHTYRAIGLPRERWDEADQRWLTAYGTQSAPLRAGAREVLGALQARGMVLGLVSSGDRRRVAGEIATQGLSAVFDTIVCGGDADQPKPHPAPLLLALDRLDLSPAETAYVGDSPEDIHMARAAGALAIGIHGGFPNQEALVASRPDLMATDLLDLPAALLG